MNDVAPSSIRHIVLYAYCPNSQRLFCERTTADLGVQGVKCGCVGFHGAQSVLSLLVMVVHIQSTDYSATPLELLDLKWSGEKYHSERRPGARRIIADVSSSNRLIDNDDPLVSDFTGLIVEEETQHAALAFTGSRARQRRRCFGFLLNFIYLLCAPICCQRRSLTSSNNTDCLLGRQPALPGLEQVMELRGGNVILDRNQQQQQAMQQAGGFTSNGQTSGFRAPGEGEQHVVLNLSTDCPAHDGV